MGGLPQISVGQNRGRHWVGVTDPHKPSFRSNTEVEYPNARRIPVAHAEPEAASCADLAVITGTDGHGKERL